jgi:putative transposase
LAGGEVQNVYVQGYEEVPELRQGLARYFAFYNGERLHQSLGDRTPAAVYAGPASCELELSLRAGEG